MPVWPLIQKAAAESFAVCQAVSNFSEQPYRFTDLQLPVPLDYGIETDWDAAEEMVRHAWTRLQRHSLARRSFWNVNFPHCPSDPSQIVLCSPDPDPLPVAFQRGEGGYWYRGNYGERPRSAGRDVDVCFGGAIALSKLSAHPHGG